MPAAGLFMVLCCGVLWGSVGVEYIRGISAWRVLDALSACVFFGGRESVNRPGKNALLAPREKCRSPSSRGGRPSGVLNGVIMLCRRPMRRSALGRGRPAAVLLSFYFRRNGFVSAGLAHHGPSIMRLSMCALSCAGISASSAACREPRIVGSVLPGAAENLSLIAAWKFCC